MKKLKKTLCGIGEIPLYLTKCCLGIVYTIAALLLIYYIISDSRGTFDLIEIIRLRASFEYLFASAIICPVCGLIADIILKKLY